MFTSHKIEKMLEMLKDKQYHTIKEIARRLKLEQTYAKRVLEFLENYSFIQLNQTKQKARITKTTHTFLEKTENQKKTRKRRPHKN